MTRQAAEQKLFKTIKTPVALIVAHRATANPEILAQDIERSRRRMKTILAIRRVKATIGR